MPNSTVLSKEGQLALGIKIATKAHDGQFDKGGKPYILHPLHLMTQLLFDTQLATIAVLHDVVEDSDIELYTLAHLGFSLRVVSALELLTHDKDDDYLGVYIPSIGTNFDAIRVKRKDLEHNSCITRLKSDDVSDRDVTRMKKYHKAFIMLGEYKKNLERR